MQLQRFFTKSPCKAVALLVMACLLWSLSAQPLLAAPDAKKDAPAATEQAGAKAKPADKKADAPTEQPLSDKEKAKQEAEAKAKQEAEDKAKAEAEAKAKAEEEAKAKAEAEERARQEAEAATAKLRAEAEAAQQQNESAASDDAVWEEAFKQNQDELNAMEIEIDGLAKGLKAITDPLHKSLSGMEEAAQRLFALSGTHKADPIMLESIDQRGVLQASSLRQQMQPVQTAHNVVQEKLTALEQMKKSLPPLPEKGSKEKLDAEQQQTRKNISRIENKLTKMNQRLTLELTPAGELLGKLEKMHTDIFAYLPKLWQEYYFSVPSRFFDPVAWQGIADRWEKTFQNMNLRLSIEFPRSQSAWQGVGLRFLNVLLMGCVVIFFVNRRMDRAEKKGTNPTAARSGILRSLLWQFSGLALLGASFGGQGEMFRGLLVLGSILVIGGEMTLAWGMRCFILGKKMGLTPLWPMYLASSLGILISYPNLPTGILSLGWIAVGMLSLLILKELHARELPGIENNLLHAHRFAIWISMAIAAIGWARMGILVLILVDCIAINTQFIIGLLQILNRSSDAQGNEQHADRSVLAGIIAAFIAPLVLLLILGGMLLWVIAMPGGALLLWHYLGTGVQVGSASFNMVHLFLIVSVFYITRAAITASKSFLNRVSAKSYKIDKTLIPPMQTGITYGLWTLFGLFTLKALGFGLENLAVIAGGLSVGIGFGMQTIVNNFLSGLILIFSRTLHEGDVIDVGTLQGVVRKISVRATTVETFDNAVIFVPNSEFVSNRLINWTRNGRIVRREVAIGVAYGTDPKLVEKLLLEVAQSIPQVVRRPQPLVLFMDFADSTLNFVLRYWSDIGTAVDAASAIRHRIVQVFAEHQVDIAFPQLDVHMIPPSPAMPSQVVKAE